MEDICLATRDSRCCFEPMRFSRHAPGDNDVTLSVAYCGVCHSDVHSAKNDLMRTSYPIVPGARPRASRLLTPPRVQLRARSPP
jgi:hypothetical protein